MNKKTKDQIALLSQREYGRQEAQAENEKCDKCVKDYQRRREKARKETLNEVMKIIDGMQKYQPNWEEEGMEYAYGEGYKFINFEELKQLLELEQSQTKHITHLEK